MIEGKCKIPKSRKNIWCIAVYGNPVKDVMPLSESQAYEEPVPTENICIGPRNI
jgi:hypothetical protein